ncbi:MAG: DegT/DnrJ/EryC1/StrS family aminotransferase [Halarcobacter sp.]
MNIKYINLSVSEDEYNKNISPLIKEVLFKGDFIGGEVVELFEKNFAKYCGSKYAISVASGTDALILALIAYGIGKNDEVITVSNSFIATANAIVMAGAKPVFVDIEDDLLIDYQKIEESITSKTRAIMPVHLMGLSCDMDEINKIAKKYNLVVIEDAAQSVGSIYKEKKTGVLGDVGCFSLHPLKNLSGIGDGGIITTNQKSIAKKLLQLRNNGLKDRDSQVVFGRVSRLDTIKASVLNYRLQYLDAIISERIKKAKKYIENLKKVKHLELIEYEQEIKLHSYHIFVVKVKKRDELQQFLLDNGIETKIHYPKLIHKNKTYKSNKYHLPKSEKLVKKILTLPLANVSNEEIEYICKKINQFYMKEN